MRNDAVLSTQAPIDAPASAARRKADGFVTPIACGVAISYIAFLVGGFRQHLWILDALGRPLVNDYVVFWVVGHLVLKGAAIAAYNASTEHAAELAAIGHSFKELLGWSYPPPFLFVVALLARMPYVFGFIAWGTATLLFQASVTAAICERRAAFFVACAAPWVPAEFILGQNGFLTAAIIGFVLLNLEKRPIIAGLALGFLSCKPQLGVLFPLALAAAGYWRAFRWAVVSTIAINLAAGFVFGFETFGAFLHALSAAAGSHLVRSDLGWNKLQSVYGLLRYAGATAAVAWSAQAATSLAAAAGVVLCWRNRAIPFPMKASFLAAATVLVTPYILYYDVPVLGIAIAFLFRHRAFDRTELVALAIEVPCLAAPFFVTVPAALLASLLIGALVIRRVFSDEFHLGTLCRSWLNLNALHSGEPKTIAVVEARPDGAA